jgi:hypothetical protein
LEDHVIEHPRIEGSTLAHHAAGSPAEALTDA